MPRSPRCAPPKPASAPTRRTCEQTRLTTETQVQIHRGQGAGADAARCETANLNLQYGTIAAPISGLIGDTLVPVGGLVNPNAAQPLTTIVPLEPDLGAVQSQRSAVSDVHEDSSAGSDKDRRMPLQLILADNSVFPQTGKIENTL